MQTDNQTTTSNTIFKTTVSTRDGQLLNVQLQGRQVHVYVSGTEVNELPEDLAKINDQFSLIEFLVQHEFTFSTPGNSPNLEIKKMDPETSKVYFRTQIERNPQVAFNYFALPSYLQGGEVIKIGNTNRTGQDLLIQAIQIDSNNYEAYAALAKSLRRGESIQIADEPWTEPWTRIELLKKAAELNPGDTWVWNELAGECLNLRGGCININGQDYTTKELYIKTIEANTNHPSAYNMLALVIPRGTSVEIAGKTWTRIQLFKKTVEQHPGEAHRWYDLGMECPEDGSVNIGRQDYTKQGLFIKTIEIDPAIARAWNQLGISLPGGETVQISKEEFTQQQLFTQAITYFKNFAEPYYNLAIVSNDPSEVKQGLLAEAIRCDSSFYDAYSFLAEILPDDVRAYIKGFNEGDSIIKREENLKGMDGKEGYTNLDLLAKMIELRPNVAKNYYLLSEKLGIHKEVMIKGERFNKAGLFNKAIQIDAYQGLLDILKLRNQPSLTLGTRVFTKEELLEKVSGSPPRKKNQAR